MTTNIYILKLENNKYYIGSSRNVDKKYQKHVNGTICSWTKKYKPLFIEKIIPSAHPYDEDKYTIKYMNMHGIDNVRGGLFSMEELDKSQRHIIKETIWEITGCCTKCGRTGNKGHTVENCYASSDVYGDPLYEDDSYDSQEYQCGNCNKQYDDEIECCKHEIECYKNKVLVNEEPYNCIYCNDEYKTLEDVTEHENLYCENKDLDDDSD